MIGSQQIKCCGYCTVVKSLLELLFFVIDDVVVVVVVFR